MEWLKNIALGRIDTHPIYDGMPERNRRSPARRQQYLEDKSKFYMHRRDASAEDNHRTNEAKRKNETLSEYIINGILYEIFIKKLNNPNSSSEELLSIIQEPIISYFVPHSRGSWFSKVFLDETVTKLAPFVRDDANFWKLVELAKSKEEIRKKSLLTNKATIINHRKTNHYSRNQWEYANVLEAWNNYHKNFYDIAWTDVECWVTDSTGKKNLMFSFVQAPEEKTSFKFPSGWSPPST